MQLIGYHATTKKNSKSILKNGFDPIKYSWQPNKPKMKRMVWTWFTKEPQFIYGNTCIKVDLTDLDCTGDDYYILCKENYISQNRILDIMFE